MGADFGLVERCSAVFGSGWADRTGFGATVGEAGLEEGEEELQVTTAGEAGREERVVTAGFLIITGGSDSSLDVLQRFLGLYL